MNILTVVLVLLVLAAIWLVFELVLTVRAARTAVQAVQKTVEEARPVVANVNDLVEQARPSVARIDPVLDQTTQAVEALTGDLRRIDAILDDVSSVSRVAGNATVAVNDAAESLATKARSLLKGRRAPRAEVPAPGQTAPAPEPTYDDVPAVLSDPAAPAPVYEEAGYFTYPAAKQQPGATDAPDPK